MIERREFLITGGALALTALPQANVPAGATQEEIMQTTNTNSFWPDSARLVISISMQMEAGAQPESDAESPLPRIDPTSAAFTTSSSPAESANNAMKIDPRRSSWRMIWPPVAAPSGEYTTG